MKAWESKNAKRALQGAGLSTMAVSLAACGGSGSDETTPVAPADQTAVQGSGRLYLKQLDAITTVDSIPLPDNLSLQTAEAAAGGLAGFVEALKIVNVEAQYLDVTGSNGNDTFYADTYAVHGIDITAGAGIDTLEVNMKGPWAQVGSLDGVEVVHVVNNENEYLVARMAGWDINVKELEPILDSADVADNSVLDLFNAPDMTKLIVSEGSFNTKGTLEVRNVNDDAEIELRGSFSQDTLITYKGGVGVLNLTLSDFFVDAGTDIELLHQSHHVKLTSTSASTSGVNDINGIVFQNELRVLEISGDAELNAGNDGNALVFDADRKAVIDASKLKADLLLEVAAHGDVTYTGTDQTTGVDSLTVTGADDNGETRISLKADFGAGSSAVNVLTISGTTIMNSDSFVKADAGAGVTLLLDTAATIDATKADLSGVDKVIFGTNDKLEITAAQFNTIGAADFSTKDNANADGQLTISGVTSTTPLDLSSVDNGDLFTVRTADASDVTLSSNTILGNLQSGVESVEILAESGNASLTMTADQFQQLNSTGTIEVVGIGGAAAAGNNPADNTPFEGTLTLTDVAQDEVIALANVEVDAVTIQVGAAGTTFTATKGFEIDDTPAGGGANETVTLEVRGTVDLTAGDLAGVDIVKLVGDATVTMSAAQANAVLFDGTGTVSVDGDITIETDAADTAGTSTAGVRFMFTADADAGRILTLTGENDIAIRGIETGANVTSFTLNDDTTAGATTITGGTPAFNLAAETLALTLDVADADSSLVIGGGDNTNEDYVAPGLATITVAQNNANSTIDLGTLGTNDSVASDLSIDVTNPSATTPPTVELSNVPATADWTLNGVTVTVNEGATIGAGSSLNLENTTKIEGTIALDSLPIAADSTLQVTSAYTAAEITALLGNLDGPNAVVVATGMTAAQLNAVAGVIEKVAAEAITGDVVLTKDVTAANMGLLVGKYDTAGDAPVVTAVATGMTVAQLDAVGAMSQVATDGITGTVVLTAESTQITAILTDTIRSATVNIDAGETAADAGDQLGAGDLAAIAARISVVDTLTNVTYVAATDTNTAGGGIGAADDGLEARALLGKTTGAKVVGTGLSAAEKVAIAENIASVAADGVTSLELINGDSVTTITTLLTKSVDAVINAGALSDATLDITTGSASANVDSTASYRVGMSVSGTGIPAGTTIAAINNNGTTLTLSANATATTTNVADASFGQLSVAQLSAIAADVSNVSAINGLTLTKDQTAAEITSLLSVAGTSTTIVLTDMSAAQVTAVAAAIDKVDLLSGETTAAVLTQLDTAATDLLNASSVTSFEGTLTATQAVFDAAEGTPTITLASDVDVTVTDAAATAISATNLATLNAETTGTITLQNAVAVTGSLSDLDALFVQVDNTPTSATEDGVHVPDGVAVTMTINDAADADTIEDIAAEELGFLGATTSGTVTVTNALDIQGTYTQMAAAIITPSSKVVAATSNLYVEGIESDGGNNNGLGDATNGWTISDRNKIEALDLTTSGTLTLATAAEAVTIDLGGDAYAGDAGVIIVTNSNVDTITGTKFSDTLIASAGNDVIDLGGGDDTLIMTVAQLAGNSETTATFDLGAGTADVLQLSDAGTTVVDADFRGITNLEQLTLANGTNTIEFGAAAAATGISKINGGTGVDTIRIVGTTDATGSIDFATGAGADVLDINVAASDAIIDLTDNDVEDFATLDLDAGAVVASVKMTATQLASFATVTAAVTDTITTTALNGVSFALTDAVDVLEFAAGDAGVVVSGDISFSGDIDKLDFSSLGSFELVNSVAGTGITISNDTALQDEGTSIAMADGKFRIVETADTALIDTVDKLVVALADGGAADAIDFADTGNALLLIGHAGGDAGGMFLYEYNGDGTAGVVAAELTLVATLGGATDPDALITTNFIFT
jgi:hypothetical protein